MQLIVAASASLLVPTESISKLITPYVCKIKEIHLKSTVNESTVQDLKQKNLNRFLEHYNE
jgi:hypothetical protein